MLISHLTTDTHGGPLLQFPRLPARDARASPLPAVPWVSAPPKLSLRTAAVPRLRSPASVAARTALPAGSPQLGSRHCIPWSLPTGPQGLRSSGPAQESGDPRGGVRELEPCDVVASSRRTGRACFGESERDVTAVGVFFAFFIIFISCSRIQAFSRRYHPPPEGHTLVR